MHHSSDLETHVVHGFVHSPQLLTGVFEMSHIHVHVYKNLYKCLAVPVCTCALVIYHVQSVYVYMHFATTQTNTELSM